MPEADLLTPVSPDVLRMADIDCTIVVTLLAKYGLSVSWIPLDQSIPGSHWGEDEAGLIKNTLYARTDTPVHSVLHEAGHWILMDEIRRECLHTDAGGTSTEENAVCYLQILMADQLPGMGRQRMFEDMDRWGYSFRLGSSGAWFEADAEDAIALLEAKGLLQEKDAVRLPVKCRNTSLKNNAETDHECRDQLE